MSDGPIVYVENKVEITGLTYDGTSRLIDVTSFIPSPGDTEATAVIVSIHNQSVTVASVKAYGGNVSPARQASVDLKANRSIRSSGTAGAQGGWYQTILPLSAGGEIYYNFPASHSATVKMYIEGWCDNTFTWDDDYSVLSGGAAGSYGDVDLGPSGDNVIGGDTGTVILAIIKRHTTDTVLGTSKTRPKGATHDAVSYSSVGCSFATVGVDSDDLYELNRNSKGTMTHELVGYLTTNSDVTMFSEPVLVTVTGDAAFHTVNLTSATSATARVAILQYEAAIAANQPAFGRALGSTNPSTYTRFQGMQGPIIAGMDADQNIELLRPAGASAFYLLGYIKYAVVPPPTPAVPSARTYIKRKTVFH